MDYKTYLNMTAVRNKELKSLRLKDPKRYTWGALARKYGISRQRAQQIGSK